jgi:hypothetical protein
VTAKADQVIYRRAFSFIPHLKFPLTPRLQPVVAYRPECSPAVFNGFQLRATKPLKTAELISNTHFLEILDASCPVIFSSLQDSTDLIS